MDIADAIYIAHSDFEKKPADKKPKLPDKTIRITEEIREFASKWLRNNWAFAYQSLQEAVKKRRSEVTVQATPIPVEEKAEAAEAQQMTEPVYILPPAIEEEIAELEAETEEIAEGLLSGWKLYYAPEGHLEDAQLIEGKTLEERYKAFANFVGKRKIPCTIPPAAIIHSFETILGTPQQDRWLWYKHVIEGIDIVWYKKKLSDGMRLCFLLDEQEHRIDFTTIHKTAMDYK